MAVTSPDQSPVSPDSGAQASPRQRIGLALWIVLAVAGGLLLPIPGLIAFTGGLTLLPFGFWVLRAAIARESVIRHPHLLSLAPCIAMFANALVMKLLWVELPEPKDPPWHSNIFLTVHILAGCGGLAGLLAQVRKLDWLILLSVWEMLVFIVLMVILYFIGAMAVSGVWL